MNWKFQIPFSKMNTEKFRNLGFAAIVVFYIILVGRDIIYKEYCGNLGFDFCAYWSGGKVSNEYGFSEIYNSEKLLEFQTKIYPVNTNTSSDFEVVPLPYLPFFLIPFKFFSLINLRLSYLIWTLLNFFGFYFYLRFFITKMTGSKPGIKLLLIAMFSLPVFLNLKLGQVNILLGICSGEFMRALSENKFYKAGVWLSGLMFKPQLLILIIPLLFIYRSKKVLVGFFSASLLISIISFALIQEKGFVELFRLIMSSSQGGATSNPQIMMNWRMIGVFLSVLIDRTFGLIVVVIGSIFTAIIFFYKFINKPDFSNKKDLAVFLVGVFTATCIITWHAHYSMSIVFIPPMFFLLSQSMMGERITDVWFYFPCGMYFLGFMLAALIALGVLPVILFNLVVLLNGLPAFIINVYLLNWAVKKYSESNSKKYSLIGID